jgi:hypothetical protein
MTAAKEAPEEPQEGTITTTTTTTADALSVGANNSEPTAIDYVGTKQSVLKLFSLPFSGQSISVGIHNVQGCLLLDADPTWATSSEMATISREPSPYQKQMKEDEVVVSASQQTAALSAISSIIEQQQRHSNNLSLPHPALDKVVELFENNNDKSGEPREYLPWEFSGMKLLVGSDAVVYRSTPPDPETSLTVRVEDAAAMRRQLEIYQKTREDSKEETTQHPGKRTYAEALRSRQLLMKEGDNRATNAARNQEDSSCTPFEFDGDSASSFQLQTTILPSTNLALAAKFTTSSDAPAKASDSQAVSPICTVIDAYLDQLIANVPQLALILREKGFVQSVKLLQTEHFAALLREETYDTSNPFEVIQQNNNQTDSEQVFDPKVLKMNATSLLNFLKTNCTKDNATYLLHREAGQSNIQLLDISSKRQKQWIWVLAMMSYRFSQRLRHLSEHMTEDAALQRTFRNRERSLLQNTLSLLEDLSDIGGQSHELLVAEVCEELADTFLRARGAEDNCEQPANTSDKPAPAISRTLQPKFSAVTPDALNKAMDYLANGACVLRQLWTQTVDEARSNAAGTGRVSANSLAEEHNTTVVSIDGDSSSDEDEEADFEALVKAEALAFQLLPLLDKIIDIALRLAEHHLGAYWSSSAMQSIRTAARRIADATEVCQFAKRKRENRHRLFVWKSRLQLQYTRLWELCGHFARSFAADELWRERGHTAGDDVVSVLREAESALPLQGNRPIPAGLSGSSPRASMLFTPFEKDLLEEAGDLTDLSGIVDKGEPETREAIESAKHLLDGKRQLGRDRRRVLVAACISYRRAIAAYEASLKFQTHKGHEPMAKDAEEQLGSEEAALLNLLLQRLGDAQNELGKLFLHELRLLLGNGAGQAHKDDKGLVRVDDKPAEPLLASAQRSFIAGLRAFEMCGDIRNGCLLRLNLCQCYKLRANSNFALARSLEEKGKGKAKSSQKTPHAEANLEKAIQQLEAAHAMIGQREADPVTWDMVSNELASTLLVLGVRRRKALLGGGQAPALLHVIRLSPGETRSILEPMEKALLIYEESGNLHQAAAVHYQLAQFFSKVWTCQRDEAQTREKLSLAFKHYNAAHAFFASSIRGNEATFVLLCLDLSNLYSTVSGEAGEECLSRVLLLCLETIPAFSPESMSQSGRSVEAQTEWLTTMGTLAGSVEDRLFKTLRSLVKLEENKTASGDEKCSYKEIYRACLDAKMHKRENNKGEIPLLTLHDILLVVKGSFLAPKT